MSERSERTGGLSLTEPHAGCEQSGTRSRAGRPGLFAERSEVAA
ncbi:hypothetical protein ACNTMW_09070 [Planosporangium sp. 12N6]